MKPRHRITVNYTGLRDKKLTGTVTVDSWDDEYFTHCQPDRSNTFKFDYEPGVFGTSGIDGPLPEMSEVVREKLKIAIDCYYDGLMGETQSFFWDGVGGNIKAAG